MVEDKISHAREIPRNGPMYDFSKIVGKRARHSELINAANGGPISLPAKKVGSNADRSSGA